MLPETMKSMVLKSPGNLELTERPVPERGRGETLVKIERVGVCGSDLHCFKGDNPFVEYPRVLGHEGSGKVAEPEPSSNLESGDQVTIDPVLNCGDCYACQIGRPNICEDLKVFGIHTDGCMQEYVSVPTRNLYGSNSVEIDSLALSEPLSIGLQANWRGEVTQNHSVGIIGAGPIGLMALFVSRYSRNAENVLVIDISTERLKRATEMGADLVCNPEEEDPSKLVEDKMTGKGPQVVIEAVGKASTVKQSIDMVSPAGRVVILGISSEPIEMNTKMFIGTEIEVVGSRLNTNQFPEAIRLLEGYEEEVRKLITHHCDLEKLEEAFELMEDPSQDVLKVMLEMP